MAVPPGYADVSIRLTLTGMSRPSYITFGVDPSDPDADTIAAAIYTSTTSAGSFLSRLDNSVSLGPITVRVGQDGGEALVGTDERVIAGGGSLTSPPPNVALLVHKRSARGGRRGRGRMFVPWYLNETDIDEAGLVLNATVASINTVLSTWKANLSGAGVPMVILHEAGLTTPGLPDVVTNLFADKLVATQRRRLGR
jgi:hypothetical protein